MFMVNNIII